jgi:multicomponent Na+:H+ antiporter subunit A
VLGFYLKLRPNLRKWIMASLPLLLSGFFIWCGLELSASGPLMARLPWAQSLEVNFSFALDGLSLMFALLISIFGAVVVLYGGDYLKGHPDLNKFYGFILMFMASMLGIVCADNLLVMFAFWEMTTFSSFLLIGFDHDNAKARASAWQAVIISAGGSLFLLAGILILAFVAGSFELSQILSQGDLIKSHAAYPAILLLCLVGAFTKSAQFPFHFWLPGAMAAPTPVSAYLHSATMVKAGIYLMLRLFPVLGGTELWFLVVSTTGMLTMLIGSFLALKQTDLKLLLAYMTVMALGTLTMLLGIGSEASLKAALAFLLAHSLYKGPLFLVVGSVDHEAGTREIEQLGGLRGKMKLTFIVALLGILSMGGLPPLLGFLGKEMIYKGTLGSAGYLTLAAVLAKSIAAGAALIFFFKTFMGSLPLKHEQVHEAPPTMWAGPLMLTLLSLILGLWTGWMERPFFAGAVASVMGHAVSGPVFPGIHFDLVLGLSVLSVGLGASIYWSAGFIRQTLIRSEAVLAWGPATLLPLMGGLLLRLAKFQTAIWQQGRMSYYLKWIFLFVTFSVGHSLLRSGPLQLNSNWLGIEFYEWVIAGLMVLAALFTILARSVLAAVTLLGVVGFGTALFYAFYGAPDLALTQFLVETLAIIVLVLVAGKLPDFKNHREHSATLLRDGLVATAFGALVTIMLWQIIETPLDPKLADYYSAQSLLAAHGRNIVNVILVDFRAIDTLGEITVLAIGSIGVYGLVKLAGKQESDQ